MGLELSVDRKQKEALKKLYRRWTGDPVQFRFLVTLVLTLLIVFAVEMPLANRLALARTRRKEAMAASTLARNVRGFVEQVQAYDPHVAVSPELVDWQAYVLELLEHTSATLISLEPKAVEARGVFQVLEMELVARGSSYREFVDFVARLEHGQRLVRVEKLRLEKHQTSMYLTCIIKGLVKSSASASAGGKGAAGGLPTMGPPFLGAPKLGNGESVPTDEPTAHDEVDESAAGADGAAAPASDADATTTEPDASATDGDASASDAPATDGEPVPGDDGSDAGASEDP